MTQEKFLKWRAELNQIRTQKLHKLRDNFIHDNSEIQEINQQTKNSLTKILLEISEYIKNNVPPLENIQDPKELSENFTQEELTIILLYKEIIQELANLSNLN